jgi:hypothetical protein
VPREQRWSTNSKYINPGDLRRNIRSDRFHGTKLCDVGIGENSDLRLEISLDSVITKVGSDLARIHIFEVHAHFCCHTIPKPQVGGGDLENDAPNVII